MTSLFPVEKIQKRIVFRRNSKPVKLWESLGISKKTVILGNFIVDQKEYFEAKEAGVRNQRTISTKTSPLRKNSFVDPFKEGLSFIHKVKKVANGLTKSMFIDPNEKFCQTDQLSLKSKTRTSMNIFQEMPKKIPDARSQDNIEHSIRMTDKAVSAGESHIVKVRKVNARNKYFRKSRNLSAWENELDLSSFNEPIN